MPWKILNAFDGVTGLRIADRASQLVKSIKDMYDAELIQFRQDMIDIACQLVVCYELIGGLLDFFETFEDRR